MNPAWAVMITLTIPLTGLIFGSLRYPLPTLPLFWQAASTSVKPVEIVALVSFMLALISSFLSIWGAIAVHELGHAITGLFARFEVKKVSVGPLIWEHTGQRWTFQYQSQSFLGGSYFGIPRGSGKLFARVACVSLGGVAANLCVSFILLYALLQVNGADYKNDVTGYLRVWSNFLSVMLLINGLFVVTNLFPFQFTDSLTSDGYRFWRALKRDPSLTREFAISKLFYFGQSDVKPRNWDSDLLIDANAIKDETSHFVYARWFRYLNLIDCGAIESAGMAIDEAIRLIEKVPETERPNLWLEHAYFLALHRSQPEPARRSFDEAAKYTVRPMLRLRAEAAIAFAERDYPRAMEKANAALDDFKRWGEPVFAQDDAEELRALMARAAASGASAI